MPDIGFHMLTDAVDVTPAVAGWVTPSAIHSKCGEDVESPATNTIDDNTTTAWRHFVVGYHWIIFDMGATKTISRIRLYQHMLAGLRWGLATGLTVYVGDNPADLGAAVWEGVLNASGWQESGEFSKDGRYVKLVTKSDSSSQIMLEFDALEWQDVDVSAHIPVGSTGVVLDIHNTHATNEYKVDVREKGSTDVDYTNGRVYHLAHFYAAIGVDANRVFQAIIESTDIKIYLCGYADSKVAFFTNYKDYTPVAGLSAWRDADVSADVSADATGVILKMVNPFETNYIQDARKKGSIEDYTADGRVYGYGHIYILVGIDANKKFQYWLPTGGLKQYLVGYCEPPVDFYTNGVDVTPAIAGSWQDVDLSDKLKADAEGAILRIRNTSAIFPLYQGEVREKDSSDDRHATADVILQGQIGALVGVDANKVCQAYIENTAVKIYLYGPMPPVVPPAKPLINKPLINPILVNPPMIRLKKGSLKFSRICLQGCIWLLR